MASDSANDGQLLSAADDPVESDWFVEKGQPIPEVEENDDVDKQEH